MAPVALGLFLILLTGTGCATSGNSGAGDRIRTLYLVTTPVAMNLDDTPGVDGLGVNLFAFGAGPKAIPLPPGTVEFTAYDSIGILANPPRPFHKWTFDVADLSRHRTEAAIGMGYRLLLNWSPKLLISSRLAVVCRFQPQQGPEVVSEPGFIAAVGDAGR
jgi:hypothetical protein